MRDRARRNRTPDSNTAFAAQSVDLTRAEDRRYVSSTINSSKVLSKTAWDWYENLGEIHYAVSRSAKVAGYAELGVYKLGRDGSIESQVTSGLPGEIASMLYSPYGGTRGLIERFITLMKIPADSYLIEVLNGKEADGFDFVSADELKTPDPTALVDGRARQGGSIERITLPAKSRFGDAEMSERVAPAAFYGRVWRPSSRFVDLADSPMVALNSICEQLHLLSIGLKAKLLSRLASNGLLYIPSEINDVRSASPSPQDGEFHQNKMLNELINAALYAARNPESPEAAVPVMVTGPGQHADQIRHIVLDQQVFDTDMKLRAELIDRILTGLDIQPSQVKGSQDANHWSAWSASEDELRVSVKPDLETMCWALTRLVLWKKMQDASMKPGAVAKHIVWYDMSGAQSHQNIAEDARQLTDRLLISGATARSATGFEERDKPDEREYIRMVGVKMDVPYLALYGLDEAENIDWEKVASKKTGPSADSPADDSSAQPGKGNPGSPSDSTSKTPARLRPA